MTHRIVEFTVTDPAYADHLAAQGLPWWRSLGEGQRDGWLCADCDMPGDTMLPVARHDGGLLMLCWRCYGGLVRRPLARR